MFFNILDFLERYLELAQGLKEVALQLTYSLIHLLTAVERKSETVNQVADEHSSEKACLYTYSRGALYWKR